MEEVRRRAGINMFLIVVVIALMGIVLGLQLAKVFGC